MSENTWFPCYVNDLLGSMRWKMMTPAQRGAYWQLICWQMQSDDGHLPSEIETLSRLAELDLSDGNACVVEAFPVNGNGRRANKRALSEWAKRRVISSSRRTAGAKGIAKRWQTDSNCHDFANGKRIAIATTSTSTSTKEHPEPQPECAEGGARSYGTISECVESILTARTGKPDAKRFKLIRVDVESAVTSMPEIHRAKTCREFVESVANMPELPKDPIGLLRGYVRHAADKPSDRKTATANQESVHAIKTRIEVATAERERLTSRERTPETVERIATLTARIKEWRKQIVGG